MMIQNSGWRAQANRVSQERGLAFSSLDFTDRWVSVANVAPSVICPWVFIILGAVASLKGYSLSLP